MLVNSFACADVMDDNVHARWSLTRSMLAECACNACKVHKLSCTHDAKTQMQIQNAHTKAIQHMGPSLGHGQFLVLNVCIVNFVFFFYLFTHILRSKRKSMSESTRAVQREHTKKEDIPTFQYAFCSSGLKQAQFLWETKLQYHQ